MVSAMDAVAARIRENMFALFDSGASGDNRDTCSRIFPELAGSYTCRGIALEPRLPGPGAIALLFEPRGLPQSELAAAVAAYSLTRREFEILHYLVLGLTNKEIAQRMEISPNTVKAFVHSISSKMNVPTRSGIVGILLGDNRGSGAKSPPASSAPVRRGAESAGGPALRTVRRPA